MAYEITIRCDIRTGNLMEKKRCHSDAQAREVTPRGEAATSRDAVYAVERRARGLGWNKVRQSAGSAKWVCPVCGEAGRFAGRLA